MNIALNISRLRSDLLVAQANRRALMDGGEWDRADAQSLYCDGVRDQIELLEVEVASAGKPYRAHKNHRGTFVNSGFSHCAPRVDYAKCLNARHLCGTWVIPQAFEGGVNNFSQIALHESAEDPGAFYAPLRIGRFN